MVTESEFAGKWKLVEAVDMVEDDLSLSPDSYLLIQVNEKSVATGSYQFAAQTATSMAGSRRITKA